jgi:hypothetical protein
MKRERKKVSTYLAELVSENLRRIDAGKRRHSRSAEFPLRLRQRCRVQCSSCFGAGYRAMFPHPYQHSIPRPWGPKSGGTVGTWERGNVGTLWEQWRAPDEGKLCMKSVARSCQGLVMVWFGIRCQHLRSKPVRDVASRSTRKCEPLSRAGSPPGTAACSASLFGSPGSLTWMRVSESRASKLELQKFLLLRYSQFRMRAMDESEDGLLWIRSCLEKEMVIGVIRWREREWDHRQQCCLRTR